MFPGGQKPLDFACTYARCMAPHPNVIGRMAKTGWPKANSLLCERAVQGHARGFLSPESPVVNDPEAGLALSLRFGQGQPGLAFNLVITQLSGGRDCRTQLLARSRER